MVNQVNIINYFPTFALHKNHASNIKLHVTDVALPLELVVKK